MSYHSAASSSASSAQPAASTSYHSYNAPPAHYAYPPDAYPPPESSQRRPQHAFAPSPPSGVSSLTPPSGSFGSFAVRRVRSSGTLQHLQQVPLQSVGGGGRYGQPAFPPSPVSPNYPGGLAAQQQASTLVGWRGEMYAPASADPGSFAYSNDPYASPAATAQPPQTPPPSARKRVVSAHPTFATPGPAQRPMSAYGSSYTGSSSLGVPEAAPMTYSHTTGPAGYSSYPQTSPEEVNQFFLDMSEMLGPEALPASLPTSPYTALPQRSAPPPPTVTLQPPSRPKKRVTYNVSGVLLDEDEYRLYADSPPASRQPSPAQPSARASYAAAGYEREGSAYLAPSQLGVPFEIQRAASAPPTPAFELEPAFQFAPYASAYEASFPYNAAAMNRRRGSSLDAAAIPRAYLSGLGGYAAPQQVQLQGEPYGGYAAPAHGVLPMSMYPPVPQLTPGPTRRPSPPSSPSRAHAPPTPVTPSPSSRVGARRGKANGSISFINFSAADSKTLLGGVAPSGSSKKRAREEEGALEREREEKRVCVRGPEE